MALQLPYFRESSLLPAPLPTEQEIEASTTVLSDSSGQKVVSVGGHFAVKFGVAVRQIEGENLLFVERNFSLAAPLLYSIYRNTENNKLYIIMELLPGATLDSTWPYLDEPEKLAITSQLGVILAQMRSLPPPTPTYYGSVSHTCIPHHLFWTDPPKLSISGPFENQHDLNMALVAQLRKLWANNNRHSFKADYLEQELSRALCNHGSTFTHSDLQRKNIIVHQTSGDSDGHRRSFTVALVDWEDAGWYPSYWEYFASFIGFEWVDDWPGKVGLFMDTWPAEAAVMKMVYQDLCF